MYNQEATAKENPMQVAAVCIYSEQASCKLAAFKFVCEKYGPLDQLPPLQDNGDYPNNII